MPEYNASCSLAAIAERKPVRNAAIKVQGSFVKKLNKIKYLCNVWIAGLALASGAAWAQGVAAADQLAQAKDDAPTSSREALFGLDKPAADKPTSTGFRGFVQLEAARAYRSQEHWSKGRLRLDVHRQGQISENLKWKIGARFDYDAAYDRSGFYPGPVREDQRYGFMLRENFFDIGAGDWDFRIGRQHIVWGEMVGLFFADVVSARDLREFILPEFEQLRTPQWALRASHYKDNTHFEALWIPVPTIDDIGKPGADFFPHPLPVPATYLGEQKPSRKLGNANYGLRLSHLRSGWDVSGFYYRSVDAAPTFYRVGVPAAPGAPFLFQARHDKINQYGGTVSKDLGSAVFKGEFVYTQGRRYNVTRLAQVDGLVRQNTLDYALGLDFTLGTDTRLNVQAFQRLFFAHDPDIIPEKRESGASLFLSGKLARNIEAQTLLVHSLNRRDWMLRPRLSWGFEKNWRLLLGADIFSGPVTGFFGRFDQADRVYTEIRYSF